MSRQESGNEKPQKGKDGMIDNIDGDSRGAGRRTEKCGAGKGKAGK